MEPEYELDQEQEMAQELELGQVLEPVPRQKMVSRSSLA